ncbi:acyltransferase family protein [Photobacterium sp. GJ3]|uniref:acyltransferase n=1 Tax=Photobacterium sp. GJ3 TaxID=2829502 RepID=UPI001B8D8E0E|nr:acyltransferase family protein [Photobacterium sp. GJ3]QUJ67358.1 acyltransferase family protein [Photobacterium sp. GJ3]
MREKIVFIDLLRCVAATAVVVIHVLGPYREMLGVLPDHAWITAVSYNSFSRWAVPVFIMITGALMLSDQRPFDLNYYLRRRLGKVLIPFIVWSVLYALLSGATGSGFQPELALSTLVAMPVHETYYHLGFFYYFIPLYLVIPFFQAWVKRADDTAVKGVTLVWMGLTTLFLFHMDGPWSAELVLYSGYLLLGYTMLRFSCPTRRWLLPLGIAALLLTDYMVISDSFAQGEYTVGRWLSYKTLNTVLIAAMVFAVCRYLADRLAEQTLSRLAFVSRYSLGIYLLHPLFLWPVRAFDWYPMHPAVMIPFWTVIAGGLALLMSWVLSRSRFTAWLVP